MTAAGNMEDGNCSEKKVEVKEDLRTIECLRGRLLAERQASKFANAEADQLGNKLIKLEIQLKEETKLRKNAEKKLRFLKKLESLKISIPISSSSSDISAHSCKSSSAITSSGLKVSEESESRQQITTPHVSQNLDYNLSDTISSSNLSQESTSIQGNSGEHSSPSCKDSIKGEVEDENESYKEDYYVDNSLALVPVAVNSERNEVKKVISIGNVRDALDALRLAKEMILSSMESRYMITVGHS